MPSSEIARFRAALSEAEPGTVVVVDFDETLWLRNSTEEYLNSLQPRAIALLILGLLDLLRPWLVLSGPDRRRLHRDWTRVVVTSVLLPWSLPLWRWHAPVRARKWRNEALLEALNARADLDLKIATLGFSALVRPLLRAILPGAELCASDRFWSLCRIRQVGKRARTEAAIGRERLGRSVVITDSEEDAELLTHCGRPFLICWPNASYEPAFSHSYIPFYYTERGKRPGQRHLLRIVLLEDILLLCLASAWLMPHPVFGAISIILLHLSFWMVYEIGYAENDTVAAINEPNPKVPPASAKHVHRVHGGMAWLTALLASAPAVLLLVHANREALPLAWRVEDLTTAFILTYGAWVAYLGVSRLTYWAYNRIDVASRALVYPILQVFRTVGYGVLLPMNMIGTKLLLSVVLARWLPYFVYRAIGQHWPGSYRLLMLAIFLLLGLEGLVIDPWEYISLQLIVATAWLAAWAHRPIRSLCANARWTIADHERVPHRSNLDRRSRHSQQGTEKRLVPDRFGLEN